MKGILFKPDMITAIAEGKKTMTRRAIKPQPPPYCDSVELLKTGAYNFYQKVDPDFHAYLKGKPRYRVAETVYTKEAWCLGAYTYKKTADIIYKLGTKCEVDVLSVGWNDWLEKHTIYGGSNVVEEKWRSPLFLPETFARYFIKITDVRAERLQDVTNEDAIKEGCQLIARTIQPFELEPIPHFTAPERPFTYRDNFIGIWDSINKQPYDWQSNPWVYVYSFKKVDKDNAIL